MESITTEYSIESPQRNNMVDILKGISIILIVLTHYNWSEEQRSNPLFCYIINMAVPVFMIISGYVGALSFERNGIAEIKDAYKYKHIIRKYLRLTIPFMMFSVWEIIDTHIPFPEGKLDRIKWFINGADGPGNYYYPIMIQLIILFPLIYIWVHDNKKKGIIFCLFLNAVFEVIKWSYGMNEEYYRLNILRYLFLLACGVYAYQYKFNKIESVAMTLLGALYIFAIYYHVYTPRILTFWSTTCFVSAMFIIPVVVYIIKNVRFRFPPLELLGKASFNIYLVQMAFYRGYAAQIDAGFSEMGGGLD